MAAPRLDLYPGRRMSVDIDLFTGALYGNIDFEAIESYLKRTFSYVHGNFGGITGMGKSYLIGLIKAILSSSISFMLTIRFFRHPSRRTGADGDC